MKMSKTKPSGFYKIFCTSCCKEARSITTTIGIIPTSLNNVDTVTDPCDNDSVVSVSHGIKEGYNEFR